MLSGRLIVDAADQDDLDRLAAGVADIELVEVDAGVAGELIRIQLRPLMAAHLSPLAAADPRAERSGPLLRVHTQPFKEG